MRLPSTPPLTPSPNSASLSLMSFAKIKTSKGAPAIQITTPEGKAYTFRRLSTKPLDPKLKAEGKLRAKAMREGFQKAVKRAVKKGVPLQKLVPVS